MRETPASMSQIRVYKCDTWESFRTEVPKIVGKLVGRRIYRGHADPHWRLVSMWERWMLRVKDPDIDGDIRTHFGNGSLEVIRDSHLHRFRDLAMGLPGQRTEFGDENEWWALGRHHGLITPLLDWTESPYVAAFFAFTDYLEQRNPGFKSGLGHINQKRGGKLGVVFFDSSPVVVWALACDGIERRGELEVVTSRRDDSHRQRAQRGVFTRLTHHNYQDLESYLASRGLADHLERYEIPGREGGKALRDLELMNITFAALFPDLGGAAAQANIGSLFEFIGG